MYIHVFVCVRARVQIQIPSVNQTEERTERLDGRQSWLFAPSLLERRKDMHLSENEGIEGLTFVVTGGLGFVGAALCKELVRRGAREVRSLDRRPSSPWSQDLLNLGVRCLQGSWFPYLCRSQLLICLLTQSFVFYFLDCLSENSIFSMNLGFH